MILRRRYPQCLAVVVKHFVEPKVGPDVKIPLAAECAAEQRHFEAFDRAAYENSRVLRYSSGWEIVADSARIPFPDSQRICIEDGRYLGRLAEQYDVARVLGIDRTPTMFINGRRVVGSAPLEVIDSLMAISLDRNPSQRTEATP